MHDGLLDPEPKFFSRDVNSQNNTYGSSENPHALIKLPLYDQKILVWYPINANRIIEPIFYEVKPRIRPWGSVALTMRLPSIRKSWH
jgi:hypothetical protein